MFNVTFNGDDIFGDDWYIFDSESRSLTIDLENRAIKNVIDKEKLVRAEVKVAYNDLEDEEITSDTITFILKFQPAEEDEEEAVQEVVATEQTKVVE